MISALNIDDLLKSAQPDSEPRGGKYVHREWTGEYWRYYYADNPAEAHGYTKIPKIDNKTFSHSLHVHATSGDPEKDYDKAVKEAFKSSDERLPVTNPNGGGDLMLHTLQQGTKSILRLSNESGAKVKDFTSRDAFVLWYLGVSNTTVFMDHKGTPMLEVRPLIGRISNNKLVPSNTKTKKTLTSGEVKEYEANKWQVTYHKDFPEERQVKAADKRWLKASRVAAEKHARKLVRDQALTEKVQPPTLDENEQKAVEGAKDTSSKAAPGSVADKIQSGKLKWRLNSETKKRELDATQGEKDAIIAQAATEYFPIIVTLANQMASNEFFTKEFRGALYGREGKGAWIERFVGSDIPKSGKAVEFLFPDPESPTYQAIDHALNTFDPAMGVSFTGYLAGKKGLLYWKMRDAQDAYIAEMKHTYAEFGNDDEKLDINEIGEAPKSPKSEGIEHLDSADEANDNNDVPKWRDSISTIMSQWKEAAPHLEREKREQIEDLLVKFDLLADHEKKEYMPRVHEALTELINWRSVLGKALEFKAIAVIKEELSKAQQSTPPILTKNKQVDPTHTYSHMEGDETNPRFYYTDSMGNMIRYSNAPAGHPDNSSNHGEATPHASEPDFATNPEYFTPDGRKLSRSPDVDHGAVEWNSQYNQFDPKNLWIGRWVDPTNGNLQYTYLDSDLRTFPKLRIHQQNAIVDTRIEDLRNYIVQCFQSDKMKDQMTALALVLLDQAKMRAVEVTALTPHDVIIEGSCITLGTRKIYADVTLVNAFELLKKFKSYDEPLFTVSMQKMDGEMDQEIHRRIGPNYLSAVLEEQGLSLLGLQTYHSTIRFVREMGKLLYNYKLPWDQALQQSLLAVALEWGHDFTHEANVEQTLQLTQSVLIDPIVIDALQQNAKDAGLLDNQQVDIIPQPSITVPYVSLELVGKTNEEQMFSQWLHTVPIHEYADSSIEKSEKAGHKYIRREGGPGNYKYYYDEPGGGGGGKGGGEPTGAIAEGTVPPMSPESQAGSLEAPVWDEAAYDQHAKEAAAQMTPEEHELLHNYSINGYSGINNALRDMADGRAPARPEHREFALNQVKQIDAAMQKSTIPQNTTLFRGMHSTNFERKNVKDENGRWTQQKIDTSYNEGDVIQWHNYTSTSASKDIAKEFADTTLAGHVPMHFEIEVAAGSSGLNMGAISNSPREKEVILPRGSKFHVVSKQVAEDGSQHFKVRLVS